MIYSAARGAVIYPAGAIKPEQYQYLPWYHDAGAQGVVVRADLATLQTACKLGLQIPNVMEERYDWPIMTGRTPMAHQKVMAAFMAHHPRSFNLSAMGTAKTLAALWAVDYLMQQGEVGSCLILSNLSTLRAVWAQEIFNNFMQRRKAVIVHGTQKARAALLAKPADFYIMNHDGVSVGTKRGRRFALGGIALALQTHPHINAAIIDEITAYKDHTAFRSKVVRQIVADYPYCW